MKIILKAVLEKNIDLKNEVIFYPAFGCKLTDNFFLLLGRSRLYDYDLERAVKIGIEIEIIGVSPENLFTVSKSLNSRGLKFQSSSTIYVTG